MIVEGPDGREYGRAVDLGPVLVKLGHANGAGLIRHWAAAGHLQAQGRDGRSPVYALNDVLAVELRMRRHSTRRGGRRRLTND